MYHWLPRNAVIVGLIRVNDRLRQLRSRFRRQAALPENANLPMLARWKSLARSGLPILLLTAPAPGASGANPRIGKFDYLAYILQLAGRDTRVDSRVVEGANHSFSNEVGKAAVPSLVTEWMSAFLPHPTGFAAGVATEAERTRADQEDGHPVLS